MNICLATPEFVPKPGGIATYYGHLAELLAGQGHQVTVLTVGEGKDRTLPAKVRLVTLDRAVQTIGRRLGRQLSGPARSALQEIALGLAMRDWLRANVDRSDINVVETVDLKGFGLFLLDPDLPPVLVTGHGSMGQICFYQKKRYSPRQRMRIGLEGMLLGLADEVITHSPMNVAEWQAYLGREVSFVVAPWTADVTLSGQRRRRGSPDEVTGLVVGRLQNWKGAFETMEALQICLERGIPVHLHWVGRDTDTAPDGGSMAGYLREQYPHLWGKHFEWVTHLDRNQVRAAQAEADFVLVPSRWDTFNFTAVEAMSVATPVVISSGAGSSYLIQDRENGLVVPPYDPAALAAAIEQLVLDGDLRRSMGQKGPVTVEREFHPDRIVRDRLEAYEMAIRRRDFRKQKPLLPFTVDCITMLSGIEEDTSFSPRAILRRLLR